jgi:tetratricopeptide (TPR) repeat protein
MELGWPLDQAGSAWLAPGSRPVSSVGSAYMGFLKRVDDGRSRPRPSLEPVESVEVLALGYREALALCRRARGEGKRQLAVVAGLRTLQVHQTAEAYVALGRAYRDQGDWRKEEICYGRSLELDPSPATNLAAYLAFATALQTTGSADDLKRALYLARVALESHRDNPMVQDIVAAIERRLRRRPAA